MINVISKPGDAAPWGSAEGAQRSSQMRNNLAVVRVARNSQALQTRGDRPSSNVFPLRRRNLRSRERTSVRAGRPPSREVTCTRPPRQASLRSVFHAESLRSAGPSAGDVSVPSDEKWLGSQDGIYEEAGACKGGRG